MSEAPGTYNPGYDQAEFTQRAKAAKIRDAIAKLDRQGVTLEEVAEELTKMLIQLRAKSLKPKLSI